MNVLGLCNMKQSYLELYEKYKQLYDDSQKQLKELMIDYNLLVKKYNELKNKEVVDGK